MKRIFAAILVILISVMCVSCKTDISLFDTVCTADEALKESKKSSVVVMEGMKCTYGERIWNKFYQTVSKGTPASVLCAQYFELNKDGISEELYEAEKDLYPMLFFYNLEYDGDVFTVTIRQSTEKEPETEESFKYLMHYTGDAAKYASFSSYDYYVLVDDQTATWEKIEAGMLSSQADAGVRHCAVYQNILD